MILGPDGKPVMGAQVVGAPKLTDFEPLKPEQMPEVDGIDEAKVDLILAPHCPSSIDRKPRWWSLCSYFPKTPRASVYVSLRVAPVTNGTQTRPRV